MAVQGVSRIFQKAPSHYDNQRAEFRPKKTEEYLRVTTDDFSRIIELYQKSAKEKALQTLNIRDQHDWDQVFVAVQQAQNDYTTNGKGAGKVAVMLGDRAPALEPWLDLLPGGEYTSILCGSLKLVLKAAAYHSEKRSQILDTLKDVPKTVRSIQDSRLLFPTDMRLDDISVELYLVLLAVIEGIIKWLVDKATWKHMKNSIQGRISDGSLEQNIKCIETKLQELRERTNHLHVRASVSTTAVLTKMEPKMTQLGVVADNIKSNTSRAVTTVEKIDGKADGIVAGVQEVKGMVDGLQESLGKGRVELCQRLYGYEMRFQRFEAGADAQNCLIKILDDVLRDRDWSRKENHELRLQLELEREKNRLRSTIATPDPALTHQEVFHLLAADPNVAHKDLELVHRQVGKFDPSSYGQAHWLFQHHQFQEWMMSWRPQVLLIDANMVSQGFSRISPTSCVCSLLIYSYEGIPNATCLHFFCGRHTGRDDPLSGPQGLIRSLIVQLLSFFDFDLGFIVSRNYRDQFAGCKLDRLCKLFRSLLRQLTIGPVVLCFIDGISLFEAAHWREDTCFVIRKLRELTDDEDINASFKLLVISPMANRYVCHQIRKEDHLVMPRDVDGDLRVLTGRQAIMRTRQPRVLYNDHASSHLDYRYSDQEEDSDKEDFDKGNLSEYDLED